MYICTECCYSKIPYAESGVLYPPYVFSLVINNQECYLAQNVPTFFGKTRSTFTRIHTAHNNFQSNISLRLINSDQIDKSYDEREHSHRVKILHVLSRLDDRNTRVQLEYKYTRRFSSFILIDYYSFIYAREFLNDKRRRGDKEKYVEWQFRTVESLKIHV